MLVCCFTYISLCFYITTLIKLLNATLSSTRDTFHLQKDNLMHQYCLWSLLLFSCHSKTLYDDFVVNLISVYISAESEFCGKKFFKQYNHLTPESGQT